jgi:hypothetical protein
MARKAKATCAGVERPRLWAEAGKAVPMAVGQASSPPDARSRLQA